MPTLTAPAARSTKSKVTPSRVTEGPLESNSLEQLSTPKQPTATEIDGLGDGIGQVANKAYKLASTRDCPLEQITTFLKSCNPWFLKEPVCSMGVIAALTRGFDRAGLSEGQVLEQLDALINANIFSGAAQEFLRGMRARQNRAS